MPSRLKKFEVYGEEPEYPKVREPLMTKAKSIKYGWFDRWQGQIVDTESTGAYIGCYLTEKDALEFSAEEVVRVRKEKKILGEN